MIKRRRPPYSELGGIAVEAIRKGEIGSTEGDLAISWYWDGGKWGPGVDVSASRNRPGRNSDTIGSCSQTAECYASSNQPRPLEAIDRFTIVVHCLVAYLNKYRTSTTSLSKKAPAFFPSQYFNYKFLRPRVNRSASWLKVCAERSTQAADRHRAGADYGCHRCKTKTFSEPSV
jgi:hypothetical protein